MSNLQKNALLRLDQVIGNKKKGVEGLMPQSKSTFYNRIKNGEYPKPIKQGRISYWRYADIEALLLKIAGGCDD